ncbi:hypothetical protein MRX96_059866 [Rhipicephalus microplus]
MNYKHIVLFLILLYTKDTNGGGPIKIPLTLKCGHGKKTSGYHQIDGHSGLTCIDQNASCEEPWKSPTFTAAIGSICHGSHVIDTDQRVNLCNGSPAQNMKEALTGHLEALYGSRGCTRDLQKDEGDPQCVEKRTEPGSPEPGALKWEFIHISIDRGLSHFRAQTVPGPDGISSRLLKCLGQEVKEQLAGLFSDIVAGAAIPDDWHRGRVSLLIKRGGRAGNLQDYRPLIVTSTMYRLFTHVLKDSSSGWAESRGWLTELQNGFRRGPRLQDNLLVLPQCA